MHNEILKVNEEARTTKKIPQEFSPLVSSSVEEEFGVTALLHQKHLQSVLINIIRFTMSASGTVGFTTN